MDRASELKHGAAAPVLSGLTALVDRVACWICVALFAAILATMVLQVAFRYVLATPLTWTEELARYLYIWACWLGAPIAMRRGNHIVITFVRERLPSRLARVVCLVTEAAALVFLVQLLIQGTILTVKSHSVDAITVPIPWSVIYLAAPLSALMMIFLTAEAMWKALGPTQEVAP